MAPAVRFMVQKTCNMFIINPFFPSLPCRYFTAEAGNLTAEQLDVCTVTLQTLAAACVDNGQILVVLEILHVKPQSQFPESGAGTPRTADPGYSSLILGSPWQIRSRSLEFWGVQAQSLFVPGCLKLFETST